MEKLYCMAVEFDYWQMNVMVLQLNENAQEIPLSLCCWGIL